MPTTDFYPFKKIPRFSRKVIVTEKIDGTNACVFIGDDGEFLTGSRTQWITPKQDNHGFSAWAHAHKEDLLKLGPGRHFGEWWGHGINRGYGLPKGDKRLSLFNTERWADNHDLPGVVGVVPILWTGYMDDLNVGNILSDLGLSGSMAAPGYTKPEGIVIYHVAGNLMFKKTFEKDDFGKTLVF